MEFAKEYIDNRELSWLKFNQRVLEEAEDENVPLFERLRFAAIFGSNLDEFFMIRVGSLWDQTLLKQEKRDNKTNLTPKEQLSLIAVKAHELILRYDLAFEKIMAELRAKGIAEELNLNKMNKQEEKYLNSYFNSEILPLLSPSIIDSKHPVQFLKNLEIYIGSILMPKDKNDGSFLIGVLPATSNNIFERIIYLPECPDGIAKYVLVENLILHYVGLVFSNYNIYRSNIFRITRNADIDINEALYDHDVDFRGVMEELLKKRKKLAPVRIEFGTYAKNDDIDKIASKLNIDFPPEFVFTQSAPLDMSFADDFIERFSKHKELFSKVLNPQPSYMLVSDEPLLKQIEKSDILFSYPYERFTSFINLLEEAGKNKDVVSIKITLYRVARGSKIVNALISAAENGKDVIALVELRARFDEENNIGWSKRLEEAGVQVFYGLGDLKVHSKLLLITKKTGNGIKYYTQIGTGNYNERTSRLYTDFTLITCDSDIGADASSVFNALSVGATVESTNALLVAPRALKSRIIEMIDTEITYKDDGYIGIKLNSLTDKDIIEKLVEAGKNGVKIELLIRGICCLIGGVPGRTENIRVISVVGRLLEHSRIYIFGKDGRQRVYLSSADFMTRNTERRVEVAAPVRNQHIKDEILYYFNALQENNIKARIQNSDGTYSMLFSGENAINKQEFFYERTEKRYNERHRLNTRKEKGLLRILKRIQSFFIKNK